jgi:hypothetical protein
MDRMGFGAERDANSEYRWAGMETQLDGLCRRMKAIY